MDTEAKGTHDSWGIDAIDVDGELRRLYGMSGSLVVKHVKQAAAKLGNDFSSIEIGSGRGKMSFYPALMGSKTYLLDSSSSALNAAELLYKSCGIQANKVEEDALDIPRNLQGKFQLSLSLGVNEHFSGKPRQGIFNAHYDVLAQGGRTVIAVPNRHCLSYRAAMVMWKLTGRWPKGLYEYGFSQSELLDRMKQAGFDNVKVYSGSYAKDDFSYFILGNLAAVFRKLRLMKKKSGDLENADLPTVETIRIKLMEQADPELFTNHQSYTWIAIGERVS